MFTKLSREMKAWGKREEVERRRRILLSIWAYAYEFENVSLVSDDRFDSESFKVDPAVDTGNARLDAFFRAEFQPSTGMWITAHPELKKVHRAYVRHHKPRRTQ